MIPVWINPCSLDPCDESVARNVLCKAERHQPRSSELVPGQSGIPAGPFRDGVYNAGGGWRESVWGASTAATTGSHWRQIHQLAGGPGHKDRRLHYCDSRDKVTPFRHLLLFVFFIRSNFWFLWKQIFAQAFHDATYVSGRATSHCLWGWPPCSVTGAQWAWRVSFPPCCITLC